MRDRLESLVESRLVTACKRHGALCPKVERVGKGWPDRVILAPTGRTVFVEVKTAGGRLEPAQVRVHKALRAVGHRVEIVWDYEQVDELIEELFG